MRVRNTAVLLVRLVDGKVGNHAPSMFNTCSSLTSIDVSNFNTEKVTNMRGMFSGISWVSHKRGKPGWMKHIHRSGFSDSLLFLRTVFFLELA